MENHGVFHGISWNFIVIQWDINGMYPLVNVYITMERSTIFNGKTHELNSHVQ